MEAMKLDFSLKELSLNRRPEPGAAAAGATSSGAPSSSGGSSAVELQEQRLLCVEYPAVVSSVDRMLDSLGGEAAVSKTYAHQNRRLELRYRPQDPFCHSLCGNRFSSSNLLLRVRRRVRRKNPQDVQIQMDLLGVIGTTYKFQGMADFQYLAVHSDAGKHTSLYDKIILRKPESQEFFERPVPHFLPPPIFSRLDAPVDYNYRPDILHNMVASRNGTFIRQNRLRRPHNAVFVSFTDPSVPAACLEAARLNWQRNCVKNSDRESEETLRKLFESRPIWSRNGVKANMNLHPDKLKLLLPVYAYYMVTGPWRSLWVRFNYDPRKNPEAKKYQMLDFRLRCGNKHGYTKSELQVKAKRSSLNYSLPITFNKLGPQAASVMDLPAHEGPSSGRETVPVSYQLKESSYIFREGMLPPHRQMFYQLCDLQVDSFRDVIDEPSGEAPLCNERDGWCVIGTTDKLRDMISGLIRKVTRAKKPVAPVLPRRSGRRRVGSKSTQRVEDEEEEEEEEEEGEGGGDDDDDDFLPSEGSENEMETEILDYI